MPKIRKTSNIKASGEPIDRRRVLLSGTALFGAAVLPSPARAADAGLMPAAEFLARTRAFVATLDPEKRKAATFAWNGSEWRGWNYFGAAGYIKPGLRLEQMNADQKTAAWNLLGTVFSP